MPRHVRPLLRGRRRAAEDHGDRDPSVYQRAAVPHQVPRAGLRTHQQDARRAALERRADPRVVPVPAERRLSMLPTERIAYSPITSRSPLKLPGGARMVVWTIVNVEEWDIHQTMPRTVLTPPAGGSPMPDIPNWAWHEYGNRVGFWRMLEVLD